MAAEAFYSLIWQMEAPDNLSEIIQKIEGVQPYLQSWIAGRQTRLF